MKIFLCFLIIFIFSSLAFYVSASDSVGSIDPSYRYAWGEKVGWINLFCSNCNVRITDNGLSGYVWIKNYGWINLAPTNGGVTNNCLGELGGKAWSTNLGWVDFSGASIDFNGKFTGRIGDSDSPAGRIDFACDNCDVRTDWRQCSLRVSPPQIRINSITDDTVPSISANIIMTNEGSVGTEYQYEWCVVTSEDNVCGGGDDVAYSSAAKFIDSGVDWVTDLSATVTNAGVYYFKVVARYGEGRSTASTLFTARTATTGGGGGGGGSSGSTSILSVSASKADFNRDGIVNSVDFSILLFYWKKPFPFKNEFVDINKDQKVDSVDFSILLSLWNK